MLKGYRRMPKYFRYGRHFGSFSKLLRESQWWDLDRLEEYQFEKLNHLLIHCYRNVPYYQKKFAEYGITPQKIKDLNDIKHLPILTRQDIRDHIHELKAINWRRYGLHEGHTSGTTGTPLIFFSDDASRSIEKAAAWRHWNWAGYNYGDPRVTIRGARSFFAKDKYGRRPLFEYDRKENNLIISSLSLTIDNMPKIIKIINNFCPNLLRLYPSTAFVLAQYLNNTKKEFCSPKAIVTSSEPLLNWHKDFIETQLGAPIFDYYGLSEIVVSANDCEKHEAYHINMEYGIIEFIDSDGNQASPGTYSQIIGTSLHNYVMPLIRYKTGDIGKYNGKKCSCGRNLPLLNGIYTKCDDLVITKEGKIITPSALTFAFKGLLDNIEKSQVIQESFEEIIVIIVKRANYSDKDTKIIKKNLDYLLESKVRVNFQFAEDIPRTEAGKYRWVISNVYGGIFD